MMEGGANQWSLRVSPRLGLLLLALRGWSMDAMAGGTLQCLYARFRRSEKGLMVGGANPCPPSYPRLLGLLLLALRGCLVMGLRLLLRPYLRLLLSPRLGLLLLALRGWSMDAMAGGTLQCLYARFRRSEKGLMVGGANHCPPYPRLLGLLLQGLRGCLVMGLRLTL